MGPHGYNVPFGHYKTVPQIVNKDHILRISELIKDVKFTTMSFKDSLKIPTKGDFIYLDPPYYPEDKNSFVQYSSNGFSNIDHELLFKLCYELYDKKIKFIMSNSYTQTVLNAFSKPKYTQYKIICSRRINSKNPESKTSEIIISNIRSKIKKPAV